MVSGTEEPLDPLLLGQTQSANICISGSCMLFAFPLPRNPISIRTNLSVLFMNLLPPCILQVNKFGISTTDQELKQFDESVRRMRIRE